MRMNKERKILQTESRKQKRYDFNGKTKDAIKTGLNEIKSNRSEKKKYKERKLQRLSIQRK